MNATSSLTQAAIILKSLPKTQAARILARLDAADIQQVLDAINLLDHVTAEQITESIERLNRDARRWKSDSEDAEDVAQLKMATRAIRTCLAGKSRKIVDENHPFAFLIHALPMVRDHLLEDEHPKNIAIVLSTMPADTASETMKSLDPVTRVSVLRRLCEITELDKQEVADLRYALKLRFKKLMNLPNNQQLGIKAAAELLSCSDAETQTTLLEFMNQSDPELAQKLSNSVIKIQDLVHLDDRDIKLLLENVDTSCWAPALKNVPLKVQKKVLDNMAMEPGRLLVGEMESIGVVDESIERLSSQQIINTLLRLHHEGRVQLGRITGSKRNLLFPKTQSVTLSAALTSAIS